MRKRLMLLGCCFYTNFVIFKIYIFGILLKGYLHKNETCTTLLFKLNESIQHCLSYDMRLMATKTFNAINLLFLYQLCRFQNIHLWHTFERLFVQTQDLAQPYFLN